MLTKKRVLVVDDENSVREALSRWLNIQGYLCTTAADGEEALALLDEESFDAVVCDIRLPGISGLEVLDEVKRRHPSTLVIMATAVDDTATKLRARETGADAYLVKPFRLEELGSALCRGLGAEQEQ